MNRPPPPQPPPVPRPSPTADEPELCFFKDSFQGLFFHLWVELVRPLNADNKEDQNAQIALDNAAWSLSEKLAYCSGNTRVNVFTAESRYEDAATRVEFVFDFERDDFAFKNTKSLRIFVPTNAKQFTLVPAHELAQIVRTIFSEQTVAQFTHKVGFTTGSSKFSAIGEIRSRLLDNVCRVMMSQFIFTTLNDSEENELPQAEESERAQTNLVPQNWAQLFPRRWVRSIAVQRYERIFDENKAKVFLFTVSNIDLSSIGGLM